MLGAAIDWGMRLPNHVLIVPAIRFYRRYLSPRKKFRCAHAHFTGGESCSDFGLRVFSEQTLPHAIGQLGEQFGRCRAASRNYMEGFEFEGGPNGLAPPGSDGMVAVCCFPDAPRL